MSSRRKTEEDLYAGKLVVEPCPYCGSIFGWEFETAQAQVGEAVLMEKIKMTEMAYIAVTNKTALGAAIDALSGLMNVGVVDKKELKIIVGQLYLWQEGLFDIIETTGEEG